MSLSVIGGNAANILAVDATSLAARTTLYDSLGNELYPRPTGSYLANIEVRATAANAAGTTFWAMRNVGMTSTAYIRRIRGTLSFDGALSAANGLRIGFYRFINATPTGGSYVMPIKKDTTYGSDVSILDIRQINTALSMNGAVLDPSPIEVVSIPASVSSMVVSFAIDFQQENPFSPCRLKAGEGLCINYESVPAIIGMTICGYCEWDERSATP